MAYKMHLWISEMYHALFNGVPVRWNADYLPPSCKLDQTDGEFRHELLLFIRGDVINLSLQRFSDTLRISQALGRWVCLSFGQADLKLQSLVSCHDCCPVSLVFGGSFHLSKIFGKFASGTGCHSPDFLQ
jgi:hypothetical protein